MFWSLCFIKHGGSAISLIYVWMVLATARHTKRLGGLGVNESKMLLYMIFCFCNPPKIRIDAFQPWNVTGGNKHRKINGSRSPLTHQPGLGCFLGKACVMCVCVWKRWVYVAMGSSRYYIYTCIYIILVNREIYVYIYMHICGHACAIYGNCARDLTWHMKQIAQHLSATACWYVLTYPHLLIGQKNTRRQPCNVPSTFSHRAPIMHCQNWHLAMPLGDVDIHSLGANGSMNVICPSKDLPLGGTFLPNCCCWIWNILDLLHMGLCGEMIPCPAGWPPSASHAMIVHHVLLQHGAIYIYIGG